MDGRLATLLAALVLAVPTWVQGQTVTAIWDPRPANEQVSDYEVCVGTSSLSCNFRFASVPEPSSTYTFSPTGGTLHYVAIRARNSAGVSPYSVEVTFSIPSLAQPANQSSVAGVAITPLNLSVVDPDGDSLTITHTGLPTGLSINSSTRQITGTPSAAGTYNVTLFVNDGLVTVSRTFVWTVTGTGGPPSGETRVSVAPGTVSRGAPVTVSWSGIAVPSSTDWLALYAPGTPDTSYIDWIYTSCSKTAGQASASGSCSFVVPSTVPAGNYEMRLLSNNGYLRLATSTAFTVTAGGGGPTLSLSVSPTTIAAGGSTTVSWSGIATPTARDWIALYPAGADDYSYLDWVYVSCSKDADTGKASGSCPFIIPVTLGAGTYEMRLLRNNEYERLATSGPITVTSSGGPSLSVSPGTISAGNSVTVSWNGISTPMAMDWIALYTPGAADEAYIVWVYVSCSQTPGAAAAAAGSCSFVVPSWVPSGTYEMRLLANNLYMRLLVSNRFAVTSSSP